MGFINISYSMIRDSSVAYRAFGMGCIVCTKGNLKNGGLN